MSLLLLKVMEKLKTDLAISLLSGENKRKQYKYLTKAIDQLGAFIVDERYIFRYNLFSEYRHIKKIGEDILTKAVIALGILEKLQAEILLENKSSAYLYGDILNINLEKESTSYKARDNSNFLFIGAGAMPLTAFYLANNNKRKITCLDIDLKALSLAEKVTNQLGIRNIKFTSTFIAATIPQYTHIILASLISPKEKIAKTVQGLMNDKAQLIVRYGTGIKALFNYGLSSEFLSGKNISIHNDTKQLYSLACYDKEKSYDK